MFCGSVWVLWVFVGFVGCCCSWGFRLFLWVLCRFMFVVVVFAVCVGFYCGCWRFLWDFVGMCGFLWVLWDCDRLNCFVSFSCVCLGFRRFLLGVVGVSGFCVCLDCDCDFFLGFYCFSWGFVGFWGL